MNLNLNLIKIRGSDELGIVVGNLSTQLNSKLVTIDGFANFPNVGNNLCIENDGSLENFRGFRKFTEVGGCVEILYNPSFMMVTSFGNLTCVGGIDTYNNCRFIGITGFNSLTDVAGSVILLKCKNLGFIPTFHKLISIYRLFIFEENGVNNIRGPSDLYHVRFLGIYDNPNPERIEGLDSFTDLVLVWIRNDPQL